MFSRKLKEGIYRGLLILNPESGIELPFNFDVKYQNKKPLIIIHNADERIRVDEIEIKGDSVNFKMPVFDTEFKTKLVGDNLEGVWINHYRTSKNVISFKAVFGEQRRFLMQAEAPNPVFEGKWEVTFSPGLKDSSKAIGVFHHLEQTDFVTGTFLTETGDYRYLEGMKNGNNLVLSCFDGSHAFLFTAEFAGNKLLNGKLYSGAHWQENWEAKRNDAFTLANAEEITVLKNKDEKIAFTFPDLNGKSVSLSDKQFENKAIIIQVMGSWCPNCMDESTYLADIYRQNKKDGLEIIALAFEKSENLDKAMAQVKRMRDRLKMDYTILVTLKTGKSKASETLPMFNSISAFPTTIFLNRRHEVVKTYTGFSGPATGNEFELFKEQNASFIKNLLKE